MFEKEIIGQTDFKRFPYSLKYIEIFQYGRRKLWYASLVFLRKNKFGYSNHRKTFSGKKIAQRSFKNSKRYWSASMWPLKVDLIFFKKDH